MQPPATLLPGAAVRAAGAPPPAAPPAAGAGPVELFLGRPLLYRRPTDATVAQTADGVSALADAGAWHAVGKLAERLLPAATPAEALRLRHHKAHALLRLRNWRAAAAELGALGDLDDGRYARAAPAPLDAGQAGSMVPFALRVLVAQLPQHCGDPATAVAQLSALCARCAAAAAAARAAGVADASLAAESLAAEANGVAARLALCNAHVLRKEPALAVQALEALLDGDGGGDGGGGDGGGGGGGVRGAESLRAALCALGRLQLQVGAVCAAEATFARLEQSARADASAEQRAELAIHRGLLQIARADFERAAGSFDAALSLAPGSCAAANNRAVCALHLCALGEAIGGLEAFVKADPPRRLAPAVVATLGALYELRDADASGARRTLDALVALAGADDLGFELAAQQRPAAGMLTGAS